MKKATPLAISTLQLMDYLYLIEESYPDGTVLQVTDDGSNIIIYDLELNLLTTVGDLIKSERGMIH